MNIFKTGISKLVFVGLVIFGVSSELFAGFTILSDVDTKICTVSGITQEQCAADMQCSASKKVCEIAVGQLGKLTETTTLNEIIKYGGQSVVYISKIMVKTGISTQKDLVNQLLTKLGNSAKFNAGMKGIKGLNKGNVSTIFFDILFDVATDMYIKGLNQNTIASIQKSGIPGFASAPRTAIETGIKNMITLAKNNFKYAMTPNKIIAARDLIIDDSLLLLDISVTVKNSTVEAVDSKLSAEQSAKYNNILALVIKYKSIYHKDPRVRSEKKYLIEEFKNKCYDEQFNGLSGFFASFKKNKYSLPSLNYNIRNTCDKYYQSLDNDERTKFSFITMSTYFPKGKYDIFVENYFPDSEQDKLKKLYNVDNFDNAYRVSKNKAVRKFIKKALAYGLTLKEFLIGKTLFDETQEIEKYKASNIIWDVLGMKTFRNENFSYEEKSVNNSYKITRREFATLLNKAFSLDSSFSNTSSLKIKGQILDQTTGWFYDALILKKLGIVVGQGIGAENKFRPDDNLTMYELLVMLTNTMDYKTCGKVGCDMYDRIGAN